MRIATTEFMPKCVIRTDQAWSWPIDRFGRPIANGGWGWIYCKFPSKCYQCGDSIMRHERVLYDRSNKHILCHACSMEKEMER